MENFIWTTWKSDRLLQEEREQQEALERKQKEKLRRKQQEELEIKKQEELEELEKQKHEEEQDDDIEILSQHQQPVYSIPSLVYYYSHIFPKTEICNWLSYSEAYPLEKREFMFSYYSQLKPEDLVVTRSKIIKNVDNLVSQLVSHPMVKIDIGPIYEKKAKGIPQDEEQKEFEMVVEKSEFVAKEFIIDIDLSDYDNVRTCCKGHNICNKCWKYAAIACFILNEELKLCWNLKHILWVFSGGRGVHGWICDKKAREYTVEERKSITSYLNLFLGGMHKKQVKFTSYPCPLVSINYEMCLKFFEQICIKEQDLLNDKENVWNFLYQLPENFRYELAYKFGFLKTSLERWNFFLQYYKEKINQPNVDTSSYKFLLQEIVVHYTFPRMDTPVSTQLEHLLKCPFSMHPKTGNLALPIDPCEADLFDVENPVKLDDLIKQHSDGNQSLEQGSPLFIFESSKKIFQDFVQKLASDTK